MDKVVFGVFRELTDYQEHCSCCGPVEVVIGQELVGLYGSEVAALQHAEEADFGEFNHEVKRLEVK